MDIYMYLIDKYCYKWIMNSSVIIIIMYFTVFMD